MNKTELLSKKSLPLNNVIYDEQGLNVKYNPGVVLTDEQFEELNPIQKAVVLRISKAEAVQLFSEKPEKKVEKKTEDTSDKKEGENKTKKSNK